MNHDGNGLDKDPAWGSQGTQTPVEAPSDVAPGAAETDGAAPEKYARRTKKPDESKRSLVVVVGLLFAVLLFALALMTAHKSSNSSRENAMSGRADQRKQAENNAGEERSMLPVTDAAHSSSRGRQPEAGFVDADEVARTATKQMGPGTASSPQPAPAAGTLGSVPPFTGWQPPPYQADAQGGTALGGNAEGADGSRTEREALEKASLVFVRTVSGNGSEKPTVQAESEAGVGLPPGTRLRARLESATSTAVDTPVIAVIEYNYEQNGEIVVPAGAKAFGHLQQADRSGYVSIRFDSLMIPEGPSMHIEGAATDLRMRPLKGRVQGRNTGKNILVRSVSGIGEAAAMLVGRGSLNQPLSEGDLLRERVSSNIGQASDEQLGRMAITEHLVVSLPAGMEIYVVLQQPTKRDFVPRAGEAKLTEHGELPSKTPTAEELRQLLQLQRELNEQSAAKQPSP